MHVIKKNPQDWTADDIAGFWDWQSKNPARQRQYFTATLAKGIVRYLKNKGLMKGHVLDYGCGAGHLLQQMVSESDASFYGLDFSADSIAEAKIKTAGNPKLKDLLLATDLPSAFAKEQFDSVTLVETIEHLQDEHLHATMQEIYRILKPGGKLFITTPNDEVLDENLNYCPFCESEFHAMQHMQSFNKDSLRALAVKHGFTVETCVDLDIDKLKTGPVKHLIKRLLIKMAIAAGLKEKTANKKPNLMAIIVKPST